MIVCQTNKESQNHLSMCLFWKTSAIVLFLYATTKKKKNINLPFMCYRRKVLHFYSYHGVWVVYALVGVYCPQQYNPPTGGDNKHGNM